MVDQPAAKKASFRTVFEVGAAHLSQAQGIAEKFQEAIAPATVNFDFGHIRAAADAIPDSAVVKMVRGWGLQETAPVHVMVMSLKEAVRQALPVTVESPAFWSKVEGTLVDAFVGIAGREGEPGLSFYREEADRTSYYRDLLFAFQDEDETGDDVYVIAFCVDVTVGLGKAELAKLGVEDTAAFAIRLNAVVVRQGAVAVEA
ncbi:Type-2Aa cytolytic delta-endotoxin [Streptomyces sp. NPDC003077]|uniref:Type-2Aa cytolytic delta-endotoxin n=1 Tax=Streptomyces sp. NPDC003077 TaxID=3154443 RepID=UPI0033AC4354